MLVTMAPSMSGVSTMPELVAVLPMTPCTNSGRNMMAPNMPADCSELAVAEIVKMLLRNNAGLMIGSAARCSRRMKATHMKPENTSEPITGHEAHG